jgi:hypothetical protein
MSCLTVPGLAWAIHMSWALNKIKDSEKECEEKLDKLLEMHYNPDNYGFGTDRQTKVIEDNTRAMNSLTYYIKWLAEKQLGEAPPPHIEDIK